MKKAAGKIKPSVIGQERRKQIYRLASFVIALASQIDEAICRRAGLKCPDYKNFLLDRYEADPDALIVVRAGRDLYLAERGKTADEETKNPVFGKDRFGEVSAKS